jgi:maltose O-acetyltransferase
MTELEKMTANVLYNCDAPEYQESWRHAAVASAKFNAISPLEDRETAVKAMKELMPNASEAALVIPPFYCDHGWPIHLAERVFINRNCEFLDSGGIYIGKHTMLGPGCKLFTPNHPIDYIQRREPVETGYAIHIGEDCWLGGNVTVCPGVTIGNRVIVAAGSVVTKDIPDWSVAVGNPCKVIRKITEADKRKLFKEEEIDEEVWKLLQ